MTEKEWYGIVKILNATYEENGKLMFEDADKIQIWYSCLSDLDYKICCEAIKRATLVSKYRPKIADIREQYNKIVNGGDAISEMEAWGLVRNAIHDSLYHAEERFSELPEFVQKIVVSPDRLRDWASLPSDTVTAVVRAEFRRAYEVTTARVAEEKMIGEKNLAIAQKLASQLSIERKE